jgi:hypothetical protein
VTLTLNMSEAVTVASGTPTLTLNDGGSASYVSGSGTSALTFSYTVGAGQNTSDLTVTAVNLGTATVTDGAGNSANLAGAVTNPAGTLQIDTTAPTVSSVVATGTGITAGAGDLAAGSVVTLTVNMSEAVTVATPTLTLNDGGVASYTGGTGTNALTFSYTVGAGQNTSDLTVSARRRRPGPGRCPRQPCTRWVLCDLLVDQVGPELQVCRRCRRPGPDKDLGHDPHAHRLEQIAHEGP